MEDVKNDIHRHIAEYIQAIAAVEDCMRPYREQRKELRKNYIENGWLDKDQISLAMQAYRMLRSRFTLKTLLKSTRTWSTLSLAPTRMSLEGTSEKL